MSKRLANDRDPGAFCYGPPPMSPKAPIHDPILGPLTDDRLTRDYRVFQRARGHRFSSDDVATAYVAWRAAGASRRVIDLGCGLGSVLLHLAWKLPEATLVGVEAQAMSFELLRRNVARNDLGERVTIHHGDLRDAAILAAAGEGFDLVTGTPPYFPKDTAVDAMDEQRAYARIEYRGGVEDYLAAGGTLLAPEGVMVLCGDARAGDRVERGAAAATLSIVARCDVVPHAGRPALFSIWTLTRSDAPCAISTLTIRDADGQRTDEARSLSEFSGFFNTR
jgi:tRNA1Val (adenine37-N6)-methyltransferase